MKIHIQKTLVVILTAVTIITSLSINTMAVYAAESNQITKADIANAIAQNRGLYCAPKFIQEFVVNLDEAVNYFNQKAQEQAEWNDIAVATAQEIKDSTTLQEKIETVYDAAIAETKSVYTCFDAVFGTVKRAFSPEVKAELMKDGKGGFILNYATHDPSKSVNALREYGLTKDDYFDYENSDSVAVYDEFVDSISTDIDTYIEEHSNYWIVRIPSYTELSILTDVNNFNTKKQYDGMQQFLQNIPDNQIYTMKIYRGGGYHFVYTQWNMNYSYLLPYGDLKTSNLVMYNDNWEEITCGDFYAFNNPAGNENMFIPAEYAGCKDAIVKCEFVEKTTKADTESYDPTYAYPYNNYLGKYRSYIMAFEYSNYFTFSKEATYIKVYKTLDAIKSASVNKVNYYINGSVYNSYDSSVDNSITYNARVNNGYIYNTIDNSVTSGMTEAEVQALIVSILEQLNNGSSGGSGDSGNGGSDSGESGSGGSGILDFVGGLGSLGNTLLSLIGNIIEIASGFIKQLGDIITGLTTGLQSATGQVGEMIASFFPFIPPEIISAITLGIVAIILIAVIKQIKG